MTVRDWVKKLESVDPDLEVVFFNEEWKYFTTYNMIINTRKLTEDEVKTSGLSLDLMEKEVFIVEE